MTLDRHVQIEDLRTFNFLPLARGGPIPRSELDRLLAKAARLAAIMGLVAEVVVAAPTAGWRIADTSSAELGSEVATDLVLSPATGVARGSVEQVHGD